MKCLILAAGYATRLYPLTENFPKPLLKVHDKTIMDWLVDDLESTGKIDEFIVVSNHKFINFFEEWKKTKNVKVSIIDDGTTSNDNRLGAIADIELAIKECNIKDDLMVVAGDNVLEFSLKHFIEFFEVKKKTSIMYYYEPDSNVMKKGANLVMDEHGKVINIVEKPEEPVSHYYCPAFYIYCKEDLNKVKQAIEDGCNIDAPGSFISYLYSKRDVYAYKMPGKRYDIGDIKTYESVNRILAFGDVSKNHN